MLIKHKIKKGCTLKYSYILEITGKQRASHKSSLLEVFYLHVFLKNLQNLTPKHLCSIFVKIQTSEAFKALANMF